MNKQLPLRPSLEQLKKQAKDLRKAHQSADPEAAPRIAEHLPRLADSSEKEILAAELSLQEAQHVLAGEYGFKSRNWLQAVVEIDFDLLTRLSDREVQILMREVDHKDLVVSLKGASDEVKDKVLGNTSERVRTFITQEMEFLGPMSPSEIEEVQQRVLRHVAALAVEGWISWPNGDRSKATKAAKPPAFEPDPELAALFARPLDQLTPDQIAEMWRGLAVQARRSGILSLEPTALQIESPFVQEALQLAVDGTEPELVRDILETRLKLAILPGQEKRGRMVIEALMSIRAGDNPAIVSHKLGAFYQSELSDSEGSDRKVPVEELATRLRDTPFAQMEPGQINTLFTGMSHLARREGIATLTPLIEATGHPLLRRGLVMIRDKVSSEQFMETSVPQLDDELRQTEARHNMVFVGIEAIQMARKPDDIAAMVKQVAVS